jgi:hypothetical protein
MPFWIQAASYSSILKYFWNESSGVLLLAALSSVLGVASERA